ncbi:hypothetical protein AAG570_006814 [Ranatra chinensis]|uniref:Longin domain-containing protein n=1 Tax=Ranatra chinensis TaxID=642074 RepID=A0ABD0Z7U4_9HEMI
MIVYALIVRTGDSMALSATTDYSDQSDTSLKENIKCVKTVANKAARLPDRCTLNLVQYDIHMISSLGVSYLVMCQSPYPMVLAFSFLSEVMKEFTTKYTSSEVSTVRRPYHFIEFDSYIHKTRQRYNRPQTLTTRINLSDLTGELQQKPPYRLSVTDVQPVQNGYKSLNIPQMGVGPPPRLEPLAWYALISMVPTVLLALLGFYRASSAIQVSSIEEYNGPTPIHALMFAVESACRLFQLYLLLYQSKYRKAESWLCLVVQILCTIVIWELRDLSIQTVFLVTAVFSHVCIITRRLQPKLPDYNV